MIKLIDRKEVVEKSKYIESVISGLQKVFYDEDDLIYYETETEKNKYKEIFDFIDGREKKVEYFNNIIGINHQDINTFTSEFSIRLESLLTHVGYSEFYILSHLKVDFFENRKNRYKPLVESYRKLEKVVGSKTYKEAFQINIENLKEIVEILFWMTRCDMSIAEYIFIFDKSGKLQLHICKHGNIHLAEYDNHLLTDDILTKYGWKIIDGREIDQFSDSSAISGRKMRI